MSAAGPFIVIGMGRSGTSYLAGLLHASGIDMGTELKQPDRFNELGYFEDLPVTQVHERWLARVGLDFGSISSDLPVDGGPEMEAELREALGPRLDQPGRWGMKPPGILFFWPMWQQLLPSTTVLLVPFRHPYAVAESYAAGHDTRERALGLWVSLNRLALHAVDSGGFESLVLDFDRPETFAGQLAPIVGPVADTYDRTIHHHRSNARLYGELAELYAELQRRTQPASATRAS
jgi:hypothetical protein